TREHLQQMVLNHVANRSRLFVKATAPLHTETLGQRDLHAANVGSIPDRLEKQIGEARVKNVMHRLLAEKVIDAKNRRLAEDAVQDGVELARRGGIAAERFFDHHPRMLGAA